MCPICSVGVVISLGLSRWLKVDDSISGIWIGALLLAFSLWTFNWIFRKSERKPVVFLLGIIVAYWVLTFIPLYMTGIISNENCLTFLGINRLIFGSILGMAIAWLAIVVDNLLRKMKQGNRLFPYQKVIIPIGFLLIVSFILNAIC